MAYGYLTPIETIEGIADKLSNGFDEPATIEAVLQATELEAKRVLRLNGFAPDFKAYAYSKPEGLTALETEQDRQAWERLQWLNEAGHLEGCGLFVIEQAAAVLQEAEAIRFYLVRGETAKAVLKAFNLMACGLLPADHQRNLEIIRLPTKLQKQRGQAGGKGKLGSQGAIKQYVSKACEVLKLDKFAPKEAAARIFKLFQEDEELSIFSHDEICPIVVESFDQDAQLLTYSAPGKPGSTKTINTERLINIIRELRREIKAEEI